MKLCHSEERVNCPQYSGNKERTIEIVEMEKGKISQIFPEENQIMFVIKGTLDLISKKIHNKNIKDGELILIPLHRTCILTALKDVTLLVLKLEFSIALCEHLPLDLLLEKHTKVKSKEEPGVGLLKPHQKIVDYANTLCDCLTEEMDCQYYHDLKIREFLFLIRAYHDKKQILSFFKPVYTGDYTFSSAIYKYLNEVRTVKGLADKLNYSLSGFEKKFKRVFDVSPYHWMQEQRAKKIYKEITCTKKTFTELAFEFDFSSPAHFNDFCKQYFQYTPGGLRKENEKRLTL